MSDSNSSSPSSQEAALKNVILKGDSLTRISFDMVPVNQPLPSSLYVPMKDRWVLFRKIGDSITLERLQQLRSSGVDALYIPKKDWHLFLKVVQGYKPPPDQRVPHIRALLLAAQKELEEKGAPPHRDLVEKLHTMVQQLAETVFQKPAIGAEHIRVNTDPDAYNANHAVNCAVYGALIGLSLKYPLDKVKLLGAACFFHDIGNIFIPSPVLLKKGPLTKMELELVQTHTTKGASFLKELGFPEEIYRSALEHHERVDGKGYPLHIPGAQIHTFAKITAIADVYDAITSTRPHQAKLSSTEAMRRMRAQEGLFDMEFLAKISLG